VPGGAAHKVCGEQLTGQDKNMSRPKCFPKPLENSTPVCGLWFFQVVSLHNQLSFFLQSRRCMCQSPVMVAAHRSPQGWKRKEKWEKKKGEKGEKGENNKKYQETKNKGEKKKEKETPEETKHGGMFYAVD
jgi:hypothetical protein